MAKWDRTEPTKLPITTGNKVGGRTGPRGFTLAELLVVILLIGIISGLGVVHYSNLTSETRVETVHASLKAFFQACTDRARQRRLNVNLQVLPAGLSVKGSPRLFCSTPAFAQTTRQFLEELSFTATQTLIHGKPINMINIEFEASRGSRKFSLSLPTAR